MSGTWRIRPAILSETPELSDLALRSKASWGYDHQFLEACRAELTIASTDLERKRVYVLEESGRIAGFYALIADPPHAELDALFVEPDAIGRGCGTRLWTHACATARGLGCISLTVQSDPYAEGLYEAMGAVRIGYSPSGSIPGRVLPVHRADLRARAETAKPSIRFRLLQETDLPLLDRWLSTPHVRTWWDRPGPTLDDIHAEYLPRLRGDADAVPYLILSADFPIGYIQRYPVRGEAWGLRPSTPAVGLDLFIGEPGYLHRGLGPRILRQFLGEIVFSDETIVECFIDPIARNRAAIRAFEKAGFRHIATVRRADPSEPIYLMRITRAQHDRSIG